MRQEQFVRVEGYTNYLVSDKGRVWSEGSQKFLSQSNIKGYKKLGLSKDGKRKFFSVHRLVALNFLANPDNKPQVNHIDEDKTNNKLSNLEWMTASENINHGTRNERISGINNGMAKSKKYYETNSTRRTHFKATCNTMGWDYNLFEETFGDWHTYPSGIRQRMYTYKLK